MRKLAILLLLAAGVAPIGCKSISDKNAKADKVAEALLASVAANDVDKICNEMLSAEAREKVARDKWENLIQIASKLGSPSNVTQTNFMIGSFNGQTVGDYKYNVAWDTGPGVLTLKLKWEGDGWKVQAMYFNSDWLLKKMAAQSQPQS
jgi:hypothetical protein